MDSPAAHGPSGRHGLQHQHQPQHQQAANGYAQQQAPAAGIAPYGFYVAGYVPAGPAAGERPPAAWHHSASAPFPTYPPAVHTPPPPPPPHGQSAHQPPASYPGPGLGPQLAPQPFPPARISESSSGGHSDSSQANLVDGADLEPVEVDGKLYYAADSPHANRNGASILVDGAKYYERLPVSLSSASDPALSPPPRPSPSLPSPHRPAPSSTSAGVAPGPGFAAPPGASNSAAEEKDKPLLSQAPFRLRSVEIVLCALAALMATFASQHAAAAVAAGTAISLGYQNFYLAWSFVSVAFSAAIFLLQCVLSCARKTRPPRYRVVGEVVGDLLVTVGWVVATLGVLDLSALSSGSGWSLRAVACQAAGAANLNGTLVCALTWCEVVVGAVVTLAFFVSLICSCTTAARPKR
ncbi:MAG: hypothetical protein BJ554DRAFT_937 [Olpidium bornovanus]|uniref:Uncharacterized protein n=1 Tax=Olpidium bornovanus TaxID=278681 RepID=A0A8H8A1L9_9FUNG|nr:MAG: hypothetical protein BJ554DRAFT_937 [Olpidium bornovanus]